MLCHTCFGVIRLTPKTCVCNCIVRLASESSSGTFRYSIRSNDISHLLYLSISFSSLDAEALAFSREECWTVRLFPFVSHNFRIIYVVLVWRSKRVLNKTWHEAALAARAAVLEHDPLRYHSSVACCIVVNWRGWLVQVYARGPRGPGARRLGA